MQQAVLLYQNETGENVVSTNYLNETQSFKKVIFPYFKCAYDCCMCSYLKDPCLSSNEDVNYYRNYNNTSDAHKRYMDDGQFIASDGMFYFIENIAGGGIILISVDVNGFNKKPNQWGRDLFSFELTKSGKILPVGAEGTTYEEDELCSNASPDPKNGIACTNKALYDANFTF